MTTLGLNSSFEVHENGNPVGYIHYDYNFHQYNCAYVWDQKEVSCNLQEFVSNLKQYEDYKKNKNDNSGSASESSNTNSRNSYEEQYPLCDSDAVLKPMKQERTAKLKPLLESSKYVLNADYSLWYKNTKSKGNGYCSSDEMIKNLFWADKNVYIVYPINYRTYYKGDDVITENDDKYDLDSIFKYSDFYSGDRKLSDSEVNTLLEKSLP